MSPAVLDTTAARLTKALADEQVVAHMPSLVAGVMREGELVWWGARGTAVRRGESTSPDDRTQYRIGSITKTMTAVLIMQLRDEGQIDLADRLDHHVTGIGYGDRTIRQLLSHSSGMQAEPAGSWWERSPGVEFDALASTIDGSAAALPAGRQYHYTNLAYGLLGELVARKRGTSWWYALRTHLLDPLGMSRTSYLAEQPAADGFSVHAFARTLTEEPAQDTKAMAPAGQVWSTVRDLAAYAGFLADPDSRVLLADSLTEMATVQSGTPEEGMTAGYGLGLRLTISGARTLIGHTGSMPGFLAGLLVDRERRTGAVCLANGTAGLRCEGLAAELLALVEEHEPCLPNEWIPTDAVPSETAEILGLWHWGETALALTYDGAELGLTRPGDDRPDLRYRQTGADTYVGLSGYHTGETLQVVRRADGEVSHLECATFIYTRRPYDPNAPIPGGRGSG
ncbi:MAG: beta-lactamase family protein [Propionibacteriales bacterium]|nr:beta-lactamase family protein [Propionibacteriales bacterium]